MDSPKCTENLILTFGMSSPREASIDLEFVSEKAWGLLHAKRL